MPSQSYVDPREEQFLRETMEKQLQLLDQQNGELLRLKKKYDAVKEQNIRLGQELSRQDSSEEKFFLVKDFQFVVDKLFADLD